MVSYFSSRRMKEMKFGKRIVAPIAFIALTLLSLGIASALPQMPHQFYGTVMIDGLPAPDGCWVDIYMEAADGTEFWWYTDTVAGLYGWDPIFTVPSDDPDTSEIEGGVNGEIVYFYVVYLGDYHYATSWVFESGAVTELNLDVSTSLYELQLYEGWNLIGIPFIPEDTSIEVILHDIMYYVYSVKSYDAETGWWYTYSPGRPSNLWDIEAGKGYWIQMTSDVLWEIDIG